MKTIQTALFCTLLAATAISARANQQYDWTGGTSGFEGVIILDSSSNASGSLSDIVAAAILTPDGTFFFNPADAELLQPAFDWSPTLIDDMGIAWVDSSTSFIAAFGENYTGVNFEADIPPSAGPTIDLAGSWVAAPSTLNVPDNAPTGLLVGLGIAGLGLACRKKSVAV
jgi:hypothetical protein